MKRILFVDDEPLLLQGLQRLLRPMRDVWKMEFVEGGAKALERVQADAPDVIVTDLMMPGMNGVQLLEAVRRVSPSTIRLILSGQADQHLALQCVGLAHQYLAKPCPPEHLSKTITRVTDLGFAVRSEKLLTVVAQLERLPSVPAIHFQVVALLNDPNSSNEDLGELISSDIALTANLLKIVNSAFFGLAQRVVKPADAVSYLGTNTLRSILMAASLLEQLNTGTGSSFDSVAAARHGHKVAAAARAIAKAEDVSQALAEECFVAGLLHDIGKLILATNLPEQFCPAGRTLSLDEERDVIGSTHAEVGGYLLGLWGLPPAAVDAARFHHAPSESATREFSALAAVHAADYLVARDPGEGDLPSAPLDIPYFTELGLADRLAAWRSCVEQLELEPASSFAP